MLSNVYIISDDPRNHKDDEEFISNLLLVLHQTESLGSFIQLRLKSLNGTEYETFLTKLNERVVSQTLSSSSYTTRLLLNCAKPEELEIIFGLVKRFNFGGVHLTGISLEYLKSNPKIIESMANTKVIAASCHNRSDLELSAQLGLSFVVLSPIKVSVTCPSEIQLGYDGFKKCVQGLGLHVYGLGGLSKEDIPHIVAIGGVGVAAIRSFWHEHQF
ncbi:thiamine phosphate synthase superfamily [Globomyces pollinis-pini]|nr:thiamine phosphate synthase superfamily [Globomyces pollinis-pini]